MSPYNPTVAKFIDPENSKICSEDLTVKIEVWILQHLRTSQYFTQIVKCKDVNCCSHPRSSLFNILPERFLCPPIPIKQSHEGLKIPNVIAENQKVHLFYPSLFVTKSLDLEKLLPKEEKKFKLIPYDLFCSSVRENLNERICKCCNLYFASVTLLRKHKSMHKETEIMPKRIRPLRVAAKRQRELMVQLKNEHLDWMDEDDLELSKIQSENSVVENQSNESDLRIPIIKLQDCFKSSWK